jgi:hypothetical protein
MKQLRQHVDVRIQVPSRLRWPFVDGCHDRGPFGLRPLVFELCNLIRDYSEIAKSKAKRSKTKDHHPIKI